MIEFSEPQTLAAAPKDQTPLERLNAAKKLEADARAGAQKQIDELDARKDVFLERHYKERKALLEALRTRPFQAKPRKPKVEETVAVKPVVMRADRA